MLTYYNFNNYLFDVIYWYSSYLTNWIITTILLFIFDYIPYNQVASVSLLSIVGMIGGLYITHINPRFISLPYFGGIRISGLQLMFADIMTHTIPALYIHHYIYNNKIIVIVDFNGLLFSIILGLMYVFFNCPCKRYHINYIDCIYVLVLSFIIFNVINLFCY
jgi:hypothetical protein